MYHRGSWPCWSPALALAVIAVLSANSELHAQTKAAALGAAGAMWGGDHVRLRVTEDGATLDFDCASGTITHAVQLDAQGNFKAAGTFTRERGGPVRKDNPNNAAAANYSGSISGDMMKMSIVAGPANDSMGEFVLYRGLQGHVMKCK